MSVKIGRLSLILVAALILTLLTSNPVHAADMRSGDSVAVAVGEVVNDDLYLAGQDVMMDGTVNGDLVAAGSRLTINGDVTGSITVAGTSVIIRGKVGKSVRAAGTNVAIHGQVSGDLVVLGSAVTTAPESQISRDIYMAVGEMNVNGAVVRSLRGSAGRLMINNSIGADVDVEAGQITLQPGADIKGSFKYTSESEAVLQPGAVIAGETTRIVPEKKDTAFSCIPARDADKGVPSAQEGAVAATIAALIGAAMSVFLAFWLVIVLVGIILRYVMALVTGIVLILILRRYIPAMVTAIKEKPWPCLGYGALKFFIAPIFIAFMLLTVIGIPLGLIALVLYLIALYLAPLLFAIFLGKWMLRQPADVTGSGALIGALALGLLLMHVCQLIPGIGALVWLASVLFGWGMVVLFARGKGK